MFTLTTEQKVTLSIVMKNFRGQTVEFDGSPTAEISDPTVASLGEVTKNADGSYSVDLIALTPTVQDVPARVIVKGDSEPGEAVNEVIASGDFTVTLDERSKQRIIEITAGAPVDK